MATVLPILAERTASITELKKNPMAVVEQGEGFVVAELKNSRHRSAITFTSSLPYQRW